MATAAKIDILLQANTAALKKGFAEATAATKKVGDSMANNVAKGMLKAHAAIMALKAAFAALRNTVTGFLESIDRMADSMDFADRIGASVEALQALRFQAEQNGASAGVLDMAWQRLRRRIGQAAAGTGELKKVLEDLGIDAQALAAEDASTQMAIWADAIKNAGDRGEQMRLVMAGMDTEGVALVEMLSQGAAGMEKWGAEASKVGIITEEQMRLAQAASAAIKRWNESWKRFKDLIVAYVLPVLIKLLDWLNKVLEKLSSLFGGRAANPFEGMADASAKAAKSMAVVAKETEKATKAAEKKTKETVKTVSLESELAKFRGSGATSVGAVTTAGGAFSAAQEARRTRQEQERRHREMIRTLEKILSAVERGEIVLAPVRF